MSKKPKPGGRVQISGKQYTVIEGPKKMPASYLLMVRAEDGGGYWAAAPSHQGGKGPWKISGPVISQDA